jgi:hypothetical protein
MKFKSESNFFRQAKHYALAYTCEKCAYYDVTTGRCINGYPNEVHKLEYHEASPPWIIPCKDFEMI